MKNFRSLFWHAKARVLKWNLCLQMKKHCEWQGIRFGDILVTSWRCVGVKAEKRGEITWKLLAFQNIIHKFDKYPWSKTGKLDFIMTMSVGVNVHIILCSLRKLFQKDVICHCLKFNSKLATHRQNTVLVISINFLNFFSNYFSVTWFEVKKYICTGDLSELMKSSSVMTEKTRIWLNRLIMTQMTKTIKELFVFHLSVWTAVTAWFCCLPWLWRR